MNNILADKEYFLKRLLHSRYLTLCLLIIILLPVFVLYLYLKNDENVISNLNVDKSLSLKYEFAIGGEGSKGNYMFSEPMGVDIGDNNDIYVADTGANLIKIFNAKGKFKKSFGKDLFYLPTDLKVFHDKVYVVDSKNSRIQIFNKEGEFEKTFVGLEIGKKIGAWIPAAIDIDSKGNVYVTDVFYHRVVVFNPNGTFKKQFGVPGNGKGQLMYPNGIAVDNQGNTYISDSNNGRIEVFDVTGKFKHILTDGKESYNLNMPRGIGINQDNIIFITETFSHNIRLLKVDNSNVVRTDIIGKRGVGNGEMNFPNDLALRDNLLCIADRANNRILVYSID